jgi:hypothetical protein
MELQMCTSATEGVRIGTAMLALTESILRGKPGARLSSEAFLIAANCVKTAPRLNSIVSFCLS